MAFTPHGGYIVSRSWDNTIKVWNVGDRRLVRTLGVHEGVVTSVAISSDGRYIVSGSWDGIMRIWRFSDGVLLATCVADKDGNWAVGAPNGLWDSNEGGEKFVGVNKTGTLKTYIPGDPECDRLRYKGLLAYIWEHGDVPGKEKR